MKKSTRYNRIVAILETLHNILVRLFSASIMLAIVCTIVAVCTHWFILALFLAIPTGLLFDHIVSEVFSYNSWDIVIPRKEI